MLSIALSACFKQSPKRLRTNEFIWCAVYLVRKAILFFISQQPLQMRLLKNTIRVNEILDLQSDIVVFVWKLSRIPKNRTFSTHSPIKTWRMSRKQIKYCYILRGRVRELVSQFPIGGDNPRALKCAEPVQFRRRRYSPDKRRYYSIKFPAPK